MLGFLLSCASSLCRSPSAPGSAAALGAALWVGVSHCPALTEEDVHAQYSQLLNVAQQVASPLAQTPGWCWIALEVCVLFLSHLIVKCVQELQINLKITLKTL